MKTTAKQIPVFKSEDAEREFWANHSPLDFMDRTSARKGVFPDLKPSLKSVSIRLPEDMLEELKVLAHKKDVPYQSLVKISRRSHLRFTALELRRGSSTEFTRNKVESGNAWKCRCDVLVAFSAYGKSDEDVTSTIHNPGSFPRSPLESFFSVA
jgi:predicted DNA binding CopG/RHH family protein